MECALGGVATNVADLSGMSLVELQYSDDPVIARSLQLVVGRSMCSHTGVLQNQFRDDI